MDGEEWARQDIMEYERANQMLIRTNTAKAVSLPSHFKILFLEKWTSDYEFSHALLPPTYYPGNHP